VEIITRGTGVSVGGGVKVDMIERMKKIERGKKKKDNHGCGSDTI
jgi:hypothetical protein